MIQLIGEDKSFGSTLIVYVRGQEVRGKLVIISSIVILSGIAFLLFAMHPRWCHLTPARPFVTRGKYIRLFLENDDSITPQLYYELLYTHANKFLSNFESPVIYGFNKLPKDFRDTESTFTLLARLEGDSRIREAPPTDDATPGFLLVADQDKISGIVYIERYRLFVYNDWRYFDYDAYIKQLDEPIKLNLVDYTLENDTCILNKSYDYYLIYDPVLSGTGGWWKSPDYNVVNSRIFFLLKNTHLAQSKQQDPKPFLDTTSP